MEIFAKDNLKNAVLKTVSEIKFGTIVIFPLLWDKFSILFVNFALEHEAVTESEIREAIHSLFITRARSQIKFISESESDMQPKDCILPEALAYAISMGTLNKNELAKVKLSKSHLRDDFVDTFCSDPGAMVKNMYDYIVGNKILQRGSLQEVSSCCEGC